MSDQIFRKKSLDRISSPEQLNDYIRVANPGIWMILAAVIILLAGACGGYSVILIQKQRLWELQKQEKSHVI